MLYANLLLNVLYHINVGMKIREFYLQNGIFIYKMGISVTKQDFHLQNGILALQMGLSSYNSPLKAPCLKAKIESQYKIIEKR